MDLQCRIDAIDEFKKTLIPTKIEISEEKSIVILYFGEEKVGLKIELREDHIVKINYRDKLIRGIKYDKDWIETIHNEINDFIFKKEGM